MSKDVEKKLYLCVIVARAKTCGIPSIYTYVRTVYASCFMSVLSVMYLENSKSPALYPPSRVPDEELSIKIKEVTEEEAKAITGSIEGFKEFMTTPMEDIKDLNTDFMLHLSGDVTFKDG